jgi:predicted alpha/beta hydrolase
MTVIVVALRIRAGGYAVITLREVWFSSGGQRCAGRLFLPPGASRRACVVMAHGTTGTMDFGLAPYAQRFAEAGLVVLAFDYRHFGASEGRPRQLISVRRQIADTAASLPLAVRAAEQAPHGELRRYPGGHFAAYLGEVRQRMVTDQTAFLRRHLAVAPAGATSNWPAVPR